MSLLTFYGAAIDDLKRFFAVGICGCVLTVFRHSKSGSPVIKN
jgi:hypothetical protein